MQLIIVREFTRTMDFHDVSCFLQICDDDLHKFMRLTEREFKRYVDEKQRAERCNEKQLALTLKGNYTKEEWEATIEEMNSGESPVAFSISDKEVQLARKFLLDYRYREELPS